MPLQNRVTPLGDLVAAPERGQAYGNRGCLHDAHGRIVRGYSGLRWIACRLEFRGRRRDTLMQPGRYTELFFLDEVTAFAAGHRPCAECRRPDYNRIVEILGLRADAIDERLHAERLPRRTHDAPFDDLPDGAFVAYSGEAHLVLGDALRRWSFAGYGAPIARPSGRAELITPPTLVEVLRVGWEPDVPLLGLSIEPSVELS